MMSKMFHCPEGMVNSGQEKDPEINSETPFKLSRGLFLQS